MHIRRYQSTDQTQWDQFIAASKNATFLLERRYMDYHQHRYSDFSLMVFDKHQHLIALLPANLQNHDVISHAGLTYGGFIVNETMTVPLMMQVFTTLFDYLLKQSVTRLIYKTIPRIYHTLPADEDLYALFRLNSTLIRRDTLTVIDTASPLPLQKRRSRAIKKAQQLLLEVKCTDDFENYWLILENNLRDRHHTTPVHSLNEIKQLAANFPQNIKLYGCYLRESLLAGVIIYESAQVAHLQYIAASTEGKANGALDYLLNELIQTIYSKKRYIDFGISNECEGRRLNQGLIDFKEGFGGRSVIHDFYQVEILPSCIDLLMQV